MRYQTWLCALAFLAPSIALAVPSVLTHQGRLLDSIGVPVQGTHALEVTLYEGSTTLHTWSFPALAFDDGFYSVSLHGLDPSWFTGTPELGLTLDSGSQFTPRTSLVSVPTAIRAAHADTAGGVIVQVAADDTDCSPAGALAWDTGDSELKVCNGSTWLRVRTAVKDIVVFGASHRYADNTYAASCLDYRQSSFPYVYNNIGSGMYHIDPTGSNPYAVHCDMVTNGGGWTLVTSNASTASASITYAQYSGTGYNMETDAGGDVVSRARHQVPLSDVMFTHPSGTTFVSTGFQLNLLALPANTAYARTGAAFPNTTFSGGGTVSSTHLYYKKTPAADHRNYIWSKYDTNAMNQDGMWCWSGTHCDGSQYSGTTGGTWEMFVR